MSPGADPRSDGSFQSETARADIEATRARIGDTLEELGARLNPGRLKQQAKNKVRDATIGRVQTMAQTTIDKATGAGRTVTDAVRENPIPAAMIAAGISWLVWSSRRSGSSTPQFESKAATGSSDRQTVRDYSDSPYAEWSTEARSASGTGATDKVREKAGDAVESVQEVAQHAKETTRGAVTNVAEVARQNSDKVTDAFQSNPLPLGLIATALGLAAGFAIPSTQKEGELVGEKRDALVEKARDLVSEKKDQARRVAQRVVSEAKSTATQVAREEGLTGGP
jgi:O6-methylguanine-DNA--protein-cysteine methyltransferase